MTTTMTTTTNTTTKYNHYNTDFKINRRSYRELFQDRLGPPKRIFGILQAHFYRCPQRFFCMPWGWEKSTLELRQLHPWESEWIRPPSNHVPRTQHSTVWKPKYRKVNRRTGSLGKAVGTATLGGPPNILNSYPEPESWKSSWMPNLQ